MKRSLLLLFVLMVSCQKQAVKNDEAADTSHNAKNSLDYVGTYKGILPCVDCHGLETEIVINENSTFCLKTRYKGKGEKVYVQKGNFSWDKKGNVITLAEVTNLPNKFFVGENTLTQLDLSGNKFKGSNADEYILSKQPTDTSSIETEDEIDDATVDLNSRISATTVIQKVNPAVGKHTLAETKWKLNSLNKKVVSQKGKKAYYLKLNSKDGKFIAYVGCNSIAGSYAMPSSETLSFTEVISTEMACGNMALETNFLAMLPQVEKYRLEGETLTLLGKGKKILAGFEVTR
ncbi:copper resistance protein NlpE N-terminal domain-containing protein [Flavobacterium sp.]